MCTGSLGKNLVQKYDLVWTMRNWYVVTFSYFLNIFEGASYTIPRYQRQHQLPFRGSLKNKKFLPTEVFIAEGKFAGVFGWNMTHTPIGGFLGLPGGQGRV